MENVLINALAEAFNVAVQKQVAQQLAALTDRVAALEDHAHGIVGELAADLAKELTQKVADRLDLRSEVENALNDIDFSDYIDTDDIATAAAEQVREDFDFKSEVRAEVREALDNFTISLNVR